MNLDYEDFESGGMTLHNPAAGRPRLPYWVYKHTEEFKRNQAAKPMIPSRDPRKSELRYWQTEDGRGHVNEVGGRRVYLGHCDDCDDVVLEIRDVSGPEFRGRGNPGHRGRWPALCDRCRERHRQESIERRRDAKRRSDRERVADKRMTARSEEEFERSRVASADETAWCDADDDAKWAQEDREAAARYQQRRGLRSPYDPVR